MPAQYVNAWRQTVAALGYARAGRLAGEAVTVTPKQAGEVGRHGHMTPSIHILDRPSPRLIAVSWSDPCSGHYGYQVWRASKAACAGRCALSGRPVHPGDLIYRPDARLRRPGNADAVIVASSVDAALDR
ncbi:hypothetical protein CY652_22560 [Burkholderia sp. WAC0059]|uniref:DUF3331 domain-containing protein n=1 Tax=Burkholderia sp. WAC0059 TaxID=2066022 RepID=UPI000C7EA20F|nr:DUF3331 domain-containing protein [Burkholderia sp. WAC0059]PLZ00168.1 hypothetical protein CY652_22560 [Burkholderia sp. WAC0059]